MKYLMLILGCALASPAMAAEEKDYADMLRDKGFTTCGASMNNIANWLLDQDGLVISQWNEKNPEAHAGTMIGSKRYSDGNAIMYVTGMKTSAGGCDVTFTHIIPVDKSCTSLREESFKEWKYFHDMLGVPVYEDPTTPNVSLMLQPLGTNCVVTKTGIVFIAKEDLK